MTVATTDFRLLTRREFCARTLLALACSFVPSCQRLRRSSLLFQPRIGAVTTGSALIEARFENEVPKLLVSQDPLAQYTRSVIGHRKERSNIAEFHIDGLQPGTEYFYGFSTQAGSVDPAGRFRTFPDGAASFRFVFASCARTGSEHEVFNTILGYDPLVFLQVGDLHYRNIGRNDRTLFQKAYSEVFGSNVQGALYANVPLIYVWDDHDFGPNNSDRFALGRIASR